jgi:inosine/xanthosine triphosphate pyrophosphatase family protein
MIFSQFKILSSNRHKIDEFVRFGLTDIKAESGPDLAEVDGTPEDVILHKSLASGPMTIVDDSILYVDGVAVVDIRWRVDAVADWYGKPVTWQVMLGVNDGDTIRAYKGVADGIMVPPRMDAWGYDPYFEVIGTGKTYAELEAEGLKDKYSARYFAARNLLNNQPAFVQSISDISPWSGDYQNSSSPAEAARKVSI